ESSRVSGYFRLRQSRDVRVRHTRQNFEFFDEAAEPRSENNSPVRVEMIPVAHDFATRLRSAYSNPRRGICAPTRRPCTSGTPQIASTSTGRPASQSIKDEGLYGPMLHERSVGESQESRVVSSRERAARSR